MIVIKSLFIVTFAQNQLDTEVWHLYNTYRKEVNMFKTQQEASNYAQKQANQMGCCYSVILEIDGHGGEMFLVKTAESLEVDEICVQTRTPEIETIEPDIVSLEDAGNFALEVLVGCVKPAGGCDDAKEIQMAIEQLCLALHKPFPTKDE
jgi:hypothetical protein